MAKKEDGTIFFDEEEQKKVDEVVKERLARHKPEDYDDLKEIEKELEAYGFSGTPAEKKAAIKAAREQADINKEKLPVEEDEDEDETSELVLKALAKKFNMKPEEIEAAIKVSADEAKSKEIKKKTDQEWNNQVKDFKTKHSDIDLDALEKDNDFIDFAKGRIGTLTQKYEEYEKYSARLKQKTAEEIKGKYKLKGMLSTSITAAGRDEGEYGLTARQKELAKGNGMTYKEYSAMLKEIE